MAGRRGTLTVMAQGKRPATYEDLVAVPAHLVAEIINGELVTSPRPASMHARASPSIGGELYGPFDRGSRSLAEGKRTAKRKARRSVSGRA